MEKEIVVFLKEKGFELVEKKSVVQFTLDNLVGFSFQKRNGIRVSFPLFKKENNGVKSTQKNNLQRDEFVEKVKDLTNIDLSNPAPIGTFETASEFISFVKKKGVIRLIKEYAEFLEVSCDFTVGEAEKDGVQIKYRSNIPTEEEIVRDVFLHCEYERKGLILKKEDVVLDLGGNIGAFTCSIFNKVKKVITFEPEDVNFEFLQSNVESNKAKNVIVNKKAVVGNDDKVRDFYLGKVPYYYSFLVKNNRKRVPVECININDVVAKYNPTKMKVDIEGSEFEVLMACKDFGRVNQIIFEYNFDMNQDLKSDFANFGKLTKHLAKHGFDVSELKNYRRTKSWADVFNCNKIA